MLPQLFKLQDCVQLMTEPITYCGFQFEGQYEHQANHKKCKSLVGAIGAFASLIPILLLLAGHLWPGIYRSVLALFSGSEPYSKFHLALRNWVQLS